MNPSFSDVVALMLIRCSSMSNIREILSFISLTCGVILGSSQIIVQSIFDIKKNNLLPSNETISEVFQKYKNNNWIGLISACVSPEIAENCSSEIKELS